MFAGDTAQTIARGVGFRFEDLRDAFYHHILPVAAAGSAAAAKTTVPPVRQLLKNYRTHSGVLSVAAEVVDALLHFFPDSIDRLEREMALTEGPPPLFIHAPLGNAVSKLVCRPFPRTSVLFLGELIAVLMRNSLASLVLMIRLTLVPSKRFWCVTTSKKRS